MNDKEIMQIIKSKAEIRKIKGGDQTILLISVIDICKEIRNTTINEILDVAKIGIYTKERELFNEKRTITTDNGAYYEVSKESLLKLKL